MSSDITGPGEPEDGRECHAVRISGRSLASNTLLNLIGQAVPLLVAVVTMPLIVRGMGMDRFGLLTLAWAVLGYFTIFDLGLGRATTKYVAEALGKGEETQITKIIWTAVTVQAIMGILGAIALLGITEVLVERVLNIPPELLGEARSAFHLLALSIPVVLIASSFSGVLEAAQRFDLINTIKVPTSILLCILPLVGLSLGFVLPGIVALIVLARLGSLVGFVLMDLRIVPGLGVYSCSSAHFPRLISFGGWVMISNLIIPLFGYLDRFLIGSLLTMSAVAFYTVPYDVVTRLLIIPGSLAAVLFPAFSNMTACKDRKKINMVTARSIKYLLTAMMPIVAILIIFSRDILMIWMGDDFAQESTGVFQLLSIGVLLNAVGFVPFALIQGIGRPDLTAKYHLVEFPVYAGVMFYLINLLGFKGAALAWCLRMAWTIPIFTVLCMKIAQVPLKALSENGTYRSIIVAAGILLASIALSRQENWELATVGLLACMLLAGYIASAWFITFDCIDKDFAKNQILRVVNCRQIEGKDVHV
jgi:O-antigen/teichoic acid export membrane protein